MGSLNNNCIPNFISLNYVVQELAHYNFSKLYKIRTKKNNIITTSQYYPTIFYSLHFNNIIYYVICDNIKINLYFD